MSNENLIRFVRFKVLTASSMTKSVYWDVATSTLVDIHRRFGGVSLHRSTSEDSHFHDWEWWIRTEASVASKCAWSDWWKSRTVFIHTCTHSHFFCLSVLRALTEVSFCAGLRNITTSGSCPTAPILSFVCKYSAKWNQILLLSVWHLNSNVGYKEPRPLPLWYVECFHQQRLKFNNM
jgi:hypothetical protein